MSVPDFSQRVAPWVLVAPRRSFEIASRLAALSDAGGIVRRVDGERMRSERDLFREFAVNLKFPSYFGYNWDALIDCFDNLHGDWHGDRDIGSSSRECRRTDQYRVSASVGFCPVSGVCEGR
ncbi:barstar family protein [Fodinicola feengrottensis]|uniref:barstar family protein n=1 Tax=Fodinicola feengrottensis TaxID=435914 RepID=UPI0036F3FA43